MLILIFFAFIAGIVTILSPCILPILPVVLSGSLGEGKKRPLGIVAGFVLSFTFFTLALSSIVQATGLGAETLRFVSVGVIAVLGISMLLPQTQVLLEKFFTKLSAFLPQQSPRSNGFAGGVLVGISLGLLWTPCVGPILASVITLAITSQVSLAAVFITLAYALGTGIPMLIITYSGRELLTKNSWLLSRTTQIQQGFGVVMLVVAVGIYYQFDRTFQTFILTTFPQYGAGLTQLEDNDLVRKQLDALQGRPTEENNSQDKSGTSRLLPLNQKAPDLVGGTNWIGTTPLSLQTELKGKVVLVDFWTYSCINCIRTFPYVTKWYEKYKDAGFVVVGVHSPEFEFEKKTQNVINAMEDFGITYPVVQDNDFAIWKAYNNRYWPAHYLIDAEGNIRYTHFGEGKYDETENAIRELLGLEPLTAVVKQPKAPSLLQKVIPSFQTHETYLGYKRAASYTNELSIKLDQVVSYSFSDPLPQDGVGLRGMWLVGPEAITSTQDGSELSLRFRAGKVFLVLAPPASGAGTAQVTLDGQPILSNYITGDMNPDGLIKIDQARKYDIIDLRGSSGSHTLEIQLSEGVEAFAFTFGE